MQSIRLAIVLAAVLLLTPWLASYTYGADNSAYAKGAVYAEAAAPGQAPSLTLFGKAIGSVTPGDLFYIDATDGTHDISVNLYLTNSDKLISGLGYLILKIGIYLEGSDGRWLKASTQEGKLIPDTFITLHNSPASFILAGCSRYMVSIDSGSFYCLTASGGDLAPEFYITVDPI